MFQRRLINSGNIIVAAGGGAVYSAAFGGVEGCDTLGGEARTSVGSSGSMRERNWYASIDLSGRWHSDGYQRRKLDLVTGFEVGKNSILSPQLFC